MKHVIIIGAGPAGLTAALELQKAGEPFEIIILEETKQIGGISQTVLWHGNRMDIGGHRFFFERQPHHGMVAGFNAAAGETFQR